MDAIEKYGKQLEIVSLKHDPEYGSLLKAIDIVKQFVKDKGLIIYGGTAIDYALRLRDSCIYPDSMLALPDIDVLSWDSVNHGRELADILFKNGFPNARSIQAIYVVTTKVDATGSRHWIADLTYVDKSIFDIIPTLIYEDMKIVHPDFQRIDLHQALAYPFDNAPGEAIFQRLNKYTERLSIITEIYPIIPERKPVSRTAITLPIKFSKKIVTGPASHALIYNSLVDLAEKLGATFDKTNIIQDEIMIDENTSTITLPCIDSAEFVEMIDYDKYKNKSKEKYKHIHSYGPFIGMIPKHLRLQFRTHVGGQNVHKTDKNNKKEEKNQEKSKSSPVSNNNHEKEKREEKEKDVDDQMEGLTDVILYDTNGKLVAINSCTFKGKVFRHTNVQTNLYLLLASSYRALNEGNKNAYEMYRAYYVSSLRMINEAEKMLAEMKDSELAKEIAVKSPFFPSVNVYGDLNHSYTYDINYNTILADQYGVELYKRPFPYRPSSGYPPTPFDPQSSKFFIRTGRRID